MLNKYFMVIVFLVLYVLYKTLHKSEHFSENNNKLKLSRPWVNLYDNNGNILNVALLSRPFFQSNDEEDYKNKIVGKFNVLGISSYQEFPNQPYNPADGYNKTTNQYNYNKWINMCKGWLHCFSNPDDYLPKNMKRILLSESDFIDCQIHKENKEVEKKYDFMYICHRDNLNDCSVDEWVAYNKNLVLAEKCFKILCKKKKLKGILVGREGCKIPTCTDANIHTTKKLDYYDLVKKYDECKIIFVPNIHDASPRVLCESLAHNLRCLVNKNLVGGWKYVNKNTGEFFNDENDFEEKIDKIIANYDSYTPRKYFVENYGIKNTGKKLKEFVYSIFKDKVNIPKEKVEYITPEFPKEKWISCEVN
jgi:hypothetical protein